MWDTSGIPMYPADQKIRINLQVEITNQSSHEFSPNFQHIVPRCHNTYHRPTLNQARVVLSCNHCMICLFYDPLLGLKVPMFRIYFDISDNIKKCYSFYFSI